MTDKDPKKSASLQSAQSADEENLLIFCKQMLKTRVFQGNYQERRYVDNLNGYRDLVVLDNVENELKGDLKYIRNRIENFYKNPDLWVGITLPEMIGAPAGLCIWTEIENQAFGKYWFQIKSIRFKSNEVLIKLKPIRPISAASTLSTPQSTATTDSENNPDNSSLTDDGVTIEKIVNLLLEWKRAASSSLMAFLSTDITKENVYDALRFMSVLFLSLMTGSLELVKFLGIFSLRLFAEMRMLLHVATPIILKLIDLMSKVVGGFYILLAMIWRDVICAARGQDNAKRLPPASQPRYRALPDSAYYRQKNNPF